MPYCVSFELGNVELWAAPVQKTDRLSSVGYRRSASKLFDRAQGVDSRMKVVEVEQR